MTQSTVDNSWLQTFLLRPIAASLLLPLVGSQEKIAQTSLPEPFGLSWVPLTVFVKIKMKRTNGRPMMKLSRTTIKHAVLFSVVILSN